MNAQARLGCLCLVLCLLISATAGINVLSQRVEVPKPDGSGVVFIQLLADPDDANIGDLTGFTISALNFIADGTQTLRLWNAAGSNCNGAELTATAPDNDVPADGKVCFFSNTSVLAEFQNSFTFVATASQVSPSNTGTVTLLNYNRQACTGIPDLGAGGSFKVPPTPSVSITLSGLQINFEVNATYIRNETTWFLDFFAFDSSAGGDSADGTDRTCSSHNPDNYPASFYDWWYTAPRATYDSTVHNTITDALGDDTYPNYDPTGTGSVWSIEALDCSTVQFEATIPVSRLVRNLTTDCYKTGYGQPAASGVQIGDSLVYTATLYVIALRPIDRSDSAAGYYVSTFAFPFTFSLQTTVSDLQTSSSTWTFSVRVLNSAVTHTGASPAFTLDLETTISAPGVNSPNVLQSGFALPNYPLEGTRTTIGAAAEPTLTRVGANAHCGTGSQLACVIHWRMVMPQLSLSDLGNSQSAFDTQYVGAYSFQWTTTGGDILAADLYADVSAVDPSTNLTTIPVTSALSFFDSAVDLQNTGATALTNPKYASGERIYVRHSFLVDNSDIQAFVFTLKQAWVCFSRVPGFAPALASGGTGCSADVPGVMEAANGERITLYDSQTLSTGILDVIASNPGEQSRIWGWTIVPPTDEDWSSGSTVNNGFAINAQPLAVDDQIHTYYFHLVSTVTQAALGRRSLGDAEEVEVHHILAMGGTGAAERDTGPVVSAGLQSVEVTEGGSGDSASSGAALTPAIVPSIRAVQELLQALW